MSTQFKQDAHNLLLIPGPIELPDQVLQSNAHPSVSHMAKDFGLTFKRTLQMIREVVFTKDAQPFLVAGSGTMGWDMVGANLLAPGESALVINSGYFGDSFADSLSSYTTTPDTSIVTLSPPNGPGSRPSLSSLETILKSPPNGGKPFKLVCFTHVDTSTAVLADAKGIAQVVKRVSPESLVVLDGVCSVGVEEIRMDDWGIDVILTASQKALSLPPGLCITVVSQRALNYAVDENKSNLGRYFLDWRRWLPIMKAYESGGAAYFATPPVQLIYAAHTSLSLITKGDLTLEQRFQIHKKESEKVKERVKKLGLKQVPQEENIASNAMTAIYAPEGIATGDIVAKMLSRGIVLAGGLHKDIKAKYFRIGHMGISVTDSNRGDISKVLDNLEAVLNDLGHKAKF